MRTLSFVKMHGIGNDFVVLDALAQALPPQLDFAAAARVLCARRHGVGGDGLLLLTTPEPGVAGDEPVAVRMRMWNPDGTEDMCGNGLRCVAQLAARRGYGTSPTFYVQTPGGRRAVQVQPGGLVRVTMGQPRFDLEAVPMLPPRHAAEVGQLAGCAIDYTLEVGGVLLSHVTTLSTGSAHTVIFTEEPVDAPTFEATFARLSPLLEHHPRFPERTSIMWTHVVDRQRLRLRIWERGAGETLACGTGACAAAVAAQRTGRGANGVTVESRGGALHIAWTPGAEILMTGPAQRVFEGEIAWPPDPIHNEAAQTMV